jgi:dipeptidyl aminopeptidase/acylaminoacyl peptidase
MLKQFTAIVSLLIAAASYGQNRLTPESLWQLGRVSGLGVSKDGKYILYSVGIPNVAENKTSRKSYMIPIDGGQPVMISKPDSLLADKNISPDGKYFLSNREVKIKKITGSDFYPELPRSNVYIYDNLMYRHWDTWEDGKFDHVFVTPAGNPALEKDIMPGQPFNCPLKPFGGNDDYSWNPDGKHIVYVTKPAYGTAYTLSTNTDIFLYDMETGSTRNLTEGMKGYDVNPQYNKKGELAWLSMKRDGYEADKQDLVVYNGVTKMNMTQQRDDIHVMGYKWSTDDRNIFFWAPINGTMQLFSVNYPGLTKMMPVIRQITKGDFDVNNIIGQSGDKLIVTRNDMNHATEIYSVDISSGDMQQLTHINDVAYGSMGTCKTERRFVKTTDGKQMLVWVIYPPDFDPAKKYPTLLYCQGGPQSPLTQSYSFRWNFQLMASQGYIVVAPARRGMQGFGTKWNEEVSKDWGGQVIRDYLSAIDNVSAEKFVDKKRRACVGASFGGYSVFALAAVHQKRFKSFISHDGVFDFRSMYGTTDEMWFENWEKGGTYWDKKNAVGQRSFSQSPSNFVDKWDTPIMIVQGGKDFRVPIEQGQQAFQAAQLRGIKSRFVYLPDENHWVLSAQNALVWQHEFYKWLVETLQ